MDLPFPKEEYAARYSKARSFMERQGLTGLFVTHPTNLYYFSGYRTFAEFSFPRPAVFLLPLQHDPVLIMQDFHLALSWDGDIREYPTVGGLPIDLVKTVFEEKGCAQGHIGAELGREQHLAISHNDFVGVQEVLPNAEFVDAANILRKIRMVKSTAEIEIISEACRIQDAVFERCFDDAKVGMTTSQIDTLLRKAILDFDAKINWRIVCVGDFEPRQAAGSSHKDRVLQSGEFLWIDLGISFRGYQSDYCRAAVAGRPSRRQLEVWEKVQKVCVAGMEAARPGISASDLCRVQMDAAEALGMDMSSWPARRFGHGSGLHTTEPPYLSMDDDTILEPGMVIHIEPGIIQSDGVYVREEKIVITGDGSRVLSHAPWQLREING